MLVASYHVLMGQAPTSHPLTLSQGASSTEQVSAPVAPSSLVPEHSSWPKWQHPSPDLVDTMPFGGTTSKATLQGPPNSKWWKMLPLHKVLTWSHSEASSQDTSLVRETREEYFKRHSPNFTTENTCDLPDILWHMAETAKLLGLAIYEIKECGRGWMNCSKLTTCWEPCQRAWYSLQWYPHWSPQRLWAWWAYMTQIHCTTSMGWPTALGVGRRAKMRAQSSTTSRQCTIGSASCAKNVTATCLLHWTSSTATAGRTANPQGREAPMSYLCLHNHQQEVYEVNLS